MRKKSDVLQIRVSPAEKEEFKLAAKRAGLSVAAFIIAECIGEQIGQQIIDGYDKKSKKKK